MKGGYRRYSVWATMSALRAMDPPDQFMATDLMEWLQKVEGPTVRPWRQDMQLKTIKTALMRGRKAGILSATLSEYQMPTWYRANLYKFRSVETMLIKAKIKPKYLDDIIEGRKRQEYRQIEDFILYDGRRTLHTVVKNISSAGALSKEIMAKYPDVPWIPELPIFIIDMQPVILYDGKEHIDLSTDGTIKPWEVERIIKGVD